MTNTTRDIHFWENKMKDSPLGVLRYIPPDTDIPVPTDEHRKAIAEARKRYQMAIGLMEPDEPFECGRLNMDRMYFEHILSRPSLLDVDDTLMDEEDVHLKHSIFGDDAQADFIMAVTGLPTLTYVGVMYEAAVVELNIEGLNDVEYGRAVELEYLAASMIIDLARDTRRELAGRRLH